MGRPKRNKPVLVIEIPTEERLEFLKDEVVALIKKMGQPTPPSQTRGEG